VPNITVTVSEEVYRNARIRAAEQGSSVSALVARYLTTLGDADERFDRLLSLQAEVLAEIGAFEAGDRLGRAELHERAVR
jgi:cyclopropane fatty-acyl-phospholipid synthase-like methyltransferase